MKLALILAVIGYCVWAVWNSVLPVAIAHAAERWPAVAGTVMASRVEVGCGRGGSHFPYVQYAYQYAGQSHVSNKIAFGNVGCGSVSDAAEVIRRYPVGTSVQVHVDPDAPSNSVLMAGSVFSGTWWTIALLSALLAGLVFAAIRERPIQG